MRKKNFWVSCTLNLCINSSNVYFPSNFTAKNLAELLEAKPSVTQDYSNHSIPFFIAQCNDKTSIFIIQF